MGPCHPNPRYNASFPSDFAPQFALLKVADAESCSAKSSALLERSSFKAIPCYSISVQRSADTVSAGPLYVQGLCSCSTCNTLLACCAAHSRLMTCVYDS